MMRNLALAAAFLFAAAAARAASPLSVGCNPQPSNVNTGQNITVLVQVSNVGSSTVYGVSTSVQAFGSAAALLQAGPSPVANDIPASGSASFTWYFQAQGCGQVAFSAVATGFDAVTVTASQSSIQVPVFCTPSPTPTITPTATATPVVTATNTPWIVYGTATPGPVRGDASIPGNLFHPDQGQPLQLKFDAPLDATVSIDLYNRLGQRVRHIERHVSPGSYTELWDGRSDQGLLVSSGIYVAQFKAKGLFKAVKFAVVK